MYCAVITGYGKFFFKPCVTNAIILIFVILFSSGSACEVASPDPTHKAAQLIELVSF